MARPLKRRYRPKPRKVTVCYVDPADLGSDAAPPAEARPKRVHPKYFEARAALRAARERRAALNMALQAGDYVTVPERCIPGLVWQVMAVNATAQRLSLAGTIFGTRQTWTVNFEDAELHDLRHNATRRGRR